jgi:hypothetical protein
LKPPKSCDEFFKSSKQNRFAEEAEFQAKATIQSADINAKTKVKCVTLFLKKTWQTNIQF